MVLRQRTWLVGSLVVALTTFTGLIGCGEGGPGNAPVKNSGPGQDPITAEGPEDTAANPDPSTKGPAEEVDLAEMLAAFEADKAVAKQEWVGKRVKFSGWSGTFNTDAVALGMPVLLCVNSQEVSSLSQVISTPRIYVDLNLKDNPWDKFNVFQPVIVEGTVAYDYGFKIKDGVVTAPEGTPSPRVTVEELAAEAEKDFKATKEKYEGRWLTVTGKVVEQTSVDPKSDLSNRLIVLYRSDALVIQGEYSSGSTPQSKIKAGETVTLGEEVDFLGPLVDQPSLIHFAMPLVIPD